MASRHWYIANSLTFEKRINDDIVSQCIYSSLLLEVASSRIFPRLPSLTIERTYVGIRTVVQ